ncbi:MAG: imidazole glycerol phosphate synthase subunit HisH [Endomicrobium sp.]|nr:imidazole glycerol phosphate synthase subunit HisH [Endomicrobium sp.]
MIAIIDYKAGNIASLLSACREIGIEAKLTNDTKIVALCTAIIIPGVGAFKTAIENLKAVGLFDILKNIDKPILGICLGMQILFERSYEGAETEGLGFIKGEVIKIPVNARLPHIGWNDLDTGEDVYFVHSYMANVASEHIVSYADYCGIRIPAIVKYKNVTGFQFHPEKSGEYGLKLLRKWHCYIEGYKCLKKE